MGNYALRTLKLLGASTVSGEALRGWTGRTTTADMRRFVPNLLSVRPLIEGV